MTFFKVSDESYLPNPLDIASAAPFGTWSNISDKLASHDPIAPPAAREDPILAAQSDDGASVSTTREIGVCTDLCNSEEPDEVEILSLINEQIPKYRLRADTITEFGGYNNEDWIQTPVIPLDTDLALTDEQIQETLKYFILCADRVTQMTRTYNDIGALTRMLEEKERDLELAARIGQTLLEKNKDLTERSDILEEQLSATNDKVSQLRHDVSMKDELLKFYCQDYDNEAESDASSPGESKGFNLKLVNIDSLQKKVSSLEEENVHLKVESSQLKSETANYEEKEKKLVEDCLSQLAEVNMQVETFAEECARKSEESARQKEEITALLAQVVDLQKRVRCLTIENMELSKHLQASQESQRKLTKELGYRQDKYDELLEVLADAQEELKTLRGKQRPGVSRQYLSSSLLNVPSDSLASELELSLRSDLDYPKGFSPSERKAHNWKIFETAKAAKKASKKSPNSASPGSNSLSPSGAESDSASGLNSKRASFYMSETESADGYSADLDSLHGSNPDLGRPGIPGSNDLETSLKRLAMRRANELNERDYREDEDRRKHSQSSATPRTPESVPSPGSGLSFLSFPGSTSSSYFKIPDKLQIVKPLEGSATLRQWQQLATPNLGGIFEERPGVQIKGERNLDLQEEVYTLSDFEEDDDISECPSRRFEESSTIFTLTDSMVKNPNDYFMLAPSASTESINNQPSIASSTTPVMSTPKGRMASMKGSNTSTYSMSLGLAAILQERDLAKPVERKPGMPYNHSFPSRVQSIVTETPYSPAKPALEVSTTSAPSTQNDGTTTSSSMASTPTDGGFLDKLKHTGFSIYGFLGGAKSEDSDSSSSDTATVSSPTSSGSITTTTVEGATASAGATSPNSDKNITRKLLTQGASAGVLGAITSFRRSGIL
ncbi:trafficking kinesin-binding protein 1-like isoform X2 [Haliotis rubra]|uniref:trafficking kinesin-binding protein 1-like isoform X2 n=1 Tax=Haliotis rubra TaxID=36100 RepID=UPI001EE51A06|nr:trafficking kinesin-binding protein 1-like isoform X2 [Haliotis rubra]